MSPLMYALASCIAMMSVLDAVTTKYSQQEIDGFASMYDILIRVSLTPKIRNPSSNEATAIKREDTETKDIDNKKQLLERLHDLLVKNIEKKNINDANRDEISPPAMKAWRGKRTTNIDTLLYNLYKKIVDK